MSPTEGCSLPEQRLTRRRMQKSRPLVGVRGAADLDTIEQRGEIARPVEAERGRRRTCEGMERTNSAAPVDSAFVIAGDKLVVALVILAREIGRGQANGAHPAERFLDAARSAPAIDVVRGSGSETFGASRQLLAQADAVAG